MPVMNPKHAYLPGKGGEGEALAAGEGQNRTADTTISVVAGGFADPRPCQGPGSKRHVPAFRDLRDHLRWNDTDLLCAATRTSALPLAARRSVSDSAP